MMQDQKIEKNIHVLRFYLQVFESSKHHCLVFICVTSGVSYFPHFHTMITQKNLEVSDFSVHLLTRFVDFFTCVVT
jgi:hypothetical protein